MSRYGNWIQTFTGRQFWPMDPRAGDFDILDIAHALSNICRFTGHCTEFYSVAQHSVLVARTLPRDLQLEGLLHDAPEAYICDIARPVKPYLANYKTVETNIARAISEQFGVPSDLSPQVKDVDNAILVDEMETLMVTPPEPWAFYADRLGIQIDPWEPKRARGEFLAAFKTVKDGGYLAGPSRLVDTDQFRHRDPDRAVLRAAHEQGLSLRRNHP
jgi:hypothetical protein